MIDVCDPNVVYDDPEGEGEGEGAVRGLARRDRDPRGHGRAGLGHQVDGVVAVGRGGHLDPLGSPDMEYGAGRMAGAGTGMGPRPSFEHSFDQSDGGGEDPFDPEDYLTFAESTTGNPKIL